MIKKLQISQRGLDMPASLCPMQGGYSEGADDIRKSN